MNLNSGAFYGKTNDKIETAFHAISKRIEGSGGKFQTQSREGAGTSITMTFNKAKAPKWFDMKRKRFANVVINLGFD